MRELLSGNPIESYGFTRRGFLRLALGAGAAVSVGALPPPALASGTAAGGQPPDGKKKAKACILLFMGGGASQLETFDPKPGGAISGGEKAIPTTVPGLEINERLPFLAREMHHLAVIRSMNTSEGNHARAVYYLHTGYKVQGGIQHPALGAMAGEQIGLDGFALPHYVAVSQRVGHHLQGPFPAGGYLGPDRSPFRIDDIANPVANVAPRGDVDPARFRARAALREALDAGFDGAHGTRAGADNTDLYRRAVRMMQNPLAAAFDLDREAPAVRETYGDTAVGDCFLLARRLVEAGVTFVEVLLNGWDTHTEHFRKSAALNGHLDRPFAALLADLHQRGLLADTLVVWMGEFGRTPAINKQAGRDHWTRGWSIALAGGGVAGGRVIGATDDRGVVKESPTAVEDLYATVGHVLGLDPERRYYTRGRRPIRALPPGGRVIAELF